MLGVAFGEFPDDAQNKFSDPVYTIIDSSQPNMILSQKYFDAYVNKIFDNVKGGKDFLIENGNVLSRCHGDGKDKYIYPNLYFMIGDFWVEVKPEDYVLDVTFERNETECIVAIYKNNEDFNIFGFPILKDYHTFFDMEEGRIGWKLSTGSTKTLMDATLPSSSLSTGQALIVYQVVIWFALACLAAGAALAWHFALYPILEKQWPNNSFYVLALSTAYFFVVAIFLAYALRPLLMLLVKASPHTGRIATQENQNLLNIGTFVYLAGALWLHHILLRSFSAKRMTPKQTSTADQVNPDQVQQLLQQVRAI